MDMLEAIHRERRDAHATGYKRIVHIRVTEDALPGSATTTPITPERARTLGRLMAIRSEGPLGGTVVADPSDYERMLELLIHPQDWYDFLSDMAAIPYVAHGEPTRVMGIAVSQ